MSATRWGIVSCGGITHDFTTALQMEPQDHEVVAVSARNLSQAEDFAKRFSIPRAFGSYEEMAMEKNIDVVYIGCIHIAHYKVCSLMMEAGHNVVCEKPLTLSYEETCKLVDLARSKGLFFLEGYWSRFFPVYDQLRKELQTNTIGDIQMVTVNLGLSMLDTPRITQKNLGGGVLMDIGGYAIQMAQLVMKDYPQKIVACGLLQDTGVDLCETITLLYSNNRMASLNLHAGLDMQNAVVIYGTKGVLEIPSMFWHPEELYTPSKKFFFPMPTPPHPMRYGGSEGFVYEQKAVRQCLLAGEKESTLMTLSETVDIARIMSEVRNQLGFSYTSDDS